jgi:hypothetical protein
VLVGVLVLAGRVQVTGGASRATSRVKLTGGCVLVGELRGVEVVVGVVADRVLVLRQRRPGASSPAPRAG